MTRKLAVPLLCVLFALACATSLTALAQAQEKQPELPQNKQTTLGHYVTAREAYDMWQKNQDHVKILDCRTPEEYRFVGHAPMAYNIPVKFMAYRWDPDKQGYVMRDNPGFVAAVRKKFTPADTILVMCVFGARGAEAVNRLAKAGFTRVYNITDGFEGDDIQDKSSPNFGKRLHNGWKNSGLPWTYELNPKLMYLPRNH